MVGVSNPNSKKDTFIMLAKIMGITIITHIGSCFVDKTKWVKFLLLVTSKK